jgi:hypothetical protein
MRNLKFTTAIIAVVLAAMSAAHAADMPVKALAPVGPFQTYTSSGLYFGAGSTAKVADSSVNGNLLATNLATGNVNAAGGTVDFEAGYIWGNASLAGFANWARVYSDVSYQNITGGISAPGNDASVASRWSAQQGVDINADLVNYFLTALNLKNPFPAFSPQPPANISVASTAHQYVGAFATEQGLKGNIGQATGTSWAAAFGVRTGWLWQTLGTSGKPNGLAFDTGIQVAWMPRGVEFDNVLASSGAVVVGKPSVTMGTTYGVYVHVLAPSLFNL